MIPATRSPSEKLYASLTHVFALCIGLLMATQPVEAHSSHAEADPNAIIFNGDFARVQVSEGEIFPDHWVWQCIDEAKATWKLNATDFGESAPSMMLSVNGTSASLYQVFNRVPPDRKFMLKGAFKKDENLKLAQIVLQVFSKNRKKPPIFLPLQQTPTKVWTKFEEAFSLPAETDGVVLTLVVEGQGRVWFDDILAAHSKPR